LKNRLESRDACKARSTVQKENDACQLQEEQYLAPIVLQINVLLDLSNAEKIVDNYTNKKNINPFTEKK
jgi:hypothetical protein